MALYIRDERAARLAKLLASRKGVTKTQAVIGALEGALVREAQPMRARIADIAREARREGDPARARAVSQREVDELWGHE